MLGLTWSSLVATPGSGSGITLAMSRRVSSADPHVETVTTLLSFSVRLYEMLCKGPKKRKKGHLKATATGA